MAHYTGPRLMVHLYFNNADSSDQPTAVMHRTDCYTIESDILRELLSGNSVETDSSRWEMWWSEALARLSARVHHLSRQNEPNTYIQETPQCCSR